MLPAIQQYNASPQFPLRNHSVGLSGRNYLMLHDTGAPVAHISMLARPATWGFFLFDLRRALSWHSLFPIFFGIFSIWFFFDTFFEKKSWYHPLAALAATFTANSAAWSFWTIYYVAGTMLAVAAILRLLRTQQKWTFFGWGALIGWGVSVSAMTLYYPRVWFGGLLATAILLGGMTDQKLWVRLKSGRVWLGLFFAVGILVTFMYAWYRGVAFDGALDLMQNSIYPGQRRDYGGDLPLWTSFIGWIAPFALFQDAVYAFNTGSNSCRIQEPMALLLPLIMYILFQWKRFPRKATIATTMMMLLFLMGYCYVHYPIWLVKAFGLERSHVWRMDYFISLGQIFLLVQFCHEENGSVLFQIFQQRIVKKIIYCAGIFLCIGLPPLILLEMPETLGKIFIGEHFARILLYTFFCGGLYGLVTLLIFHKIRCATMIFFALEIASGVCFNPICIAPKKLTSPLLRQVQRESASWHNEGRVLICGSRSAGNLYAAAGGKTLAGYFEYEDIEIFNLLLKDPSFHRMNEMIVFIAAPSKPLIAIKGVGLTTIRVQLNGRYFDFSQLPIDYVLTKNTKEKNFLTKNRSLQYLGKIKDHYRFRVLHDR